MYKKIFFTFTILCLCLNSVFAQDHHLGLGVILGEPTGISLKLWQDRNIAYAGSVAWTTKGNDDALHLHADILMHMYNFVEVSEGELPIYFGLGGRIKFEKDDRLGIRFPIGFAYEFEKTPLDIFVEIVPVFDLIPDTELTMNGGIGIRYFF